MKLHDLQEGTWDNPDSIAKAKKLAKTMSKPIPKKDYASTLSGLIGDDDLYDRIEDAVRKDDPQDTDVRWLIADKLKEWLKNLDQFIKPWNPQAIKIVKQIANKKY